MLRNSGIVIKYYFFCVKSYKKCKVNKNVLFFFTKSVM